MVLTVRVLVVLAGLAAIGIAVSEYRLLRAVDRSDPASSLEQIKAWQPWGGLASLHASRILSLRWRSDPHQAEQLLSWQLQRYPIDPQGWLVRSTVAFQTDAPVEQRAAHLKAAAATQPHNRAVRWQAAMTSLRAGDTDLTEQHLKLAARGDRRYTSRALFMAQRWINSPDELLDRIVPSTEEHLTAAMRHARDTEQLELAEAIWQRLEQPREPWDRVVSDYLELAFGAGDHERVMSVWAELDPAYRRGNVPAGSFHLPWDAMSTFGWRVRMPEGVRVELDEELPVTEQGTLSSAAPPEARSLRLDFDGNENLRLRHPVVQFPIPETGQYRLQGWWRGEHLTTRSLPRLDIGLRHGSLRERVQTPRGHFDWQPFQIDFEVGVNNEIMTLRVVREQTDAFDRYIAGRLWLSHLEVVELESTDTGPMSIHDESVPAASEIHR